MPQELLEREGTGRAVALPLAAPQRRVEGDRQSGDEEVPGELGRHVGDLLLADGAAERGEDRPGVLLGGGPGHPFALGDPAQELLEVERFGVDAVPQEGVKLGR